MNVSVTVMHTIELICYLACLVVVLGPSTKRTVFGGARGPLALGLLVVMGTNVCDLLQWGLGVESADMYGDYLAVALPFAWIAVLMSVVREVRLSQIMASEETTRTMLESVPMAVFVFDSADNVVAVGGAFEELTGRAPEGVVGHPKPSMSAITHTDDIPLHEDFVKRARKGPAKVRFRILRPDGTVSHVEIVSRPALGRGGEYRGRQTAMRDITDEIETRREIDRLQHQYELLSASDLVGKFIVQDDTLVFANRTLARILGCETEETSGPNVVGELRTEERRMIAALLTNAGRDAQTMGEDEIRVRLDSGETRWARAWTQQMTDDAGRPVLTGHVVDVTESRQLRDQLEHSQRLDAIGTLAGGVAHEFNNALQTIIGNTSLLQINRGPADEDMEKLDAIMKETRRASALADRLLAFGRQTKVEIGPVHLNDLIADTAELLRRTIDRRVDIELDLADDLHTARGDRDRLQQVIMNLALNARDAIDGQGTVVLRTRNRELGERYSRENVNVEPGTYALLQVGDTGHGMDPETLARVFEPFFTTKPVGVGTGLGLSIVHGIVEAHGGHIRVHSEVGSGTTVSVYLPISGDETSEQRQHTMPDAAMMGRGTILAIDDEPAIRTLVSEGLGRFGYTVLTAEDGIDGLEKFTAQKDEIELVILDLIMPRMDGYECLQGLRTLVPEVKVLVATGYAPGEQEMPLQRGPNTHFLYKPFTIEELAAMVHELIGED